jgi:SAM-dependent methyltransferase
VSDYLELNRRNWDNRAPVHAASEDYGVERYEADPDLLSEVVAFDRPLLCDVAGLRAAHLQCHIGTDTISLARLGARVTGLDFSPASLAQARRLAERAGADVDFVESDVYDAPRVLGSDAFDLVYTGIGALCWLPSIDRWAAAVAGVLKPGGRLFMREGHPVLWAVDEEQDGLVLDYPYFEREEPVVWTDGATYVKTDTPLPATTTNEWNHGIGEIITALFEHGMRLTGFVEHRSVPYEALPGRMVNEGGEWLLAERDWRMPLSYTLQAVKSS